MTTIPERHEIPDAHKWDLTPMFADDAAWDALFRETEARIPGYKTYQGRLNESASVLKEAIDYDLSVNRSLELLYTYAHLRNDEDKTNATYDGLFQKAVNLYARIAQASSFFTPEVQAIDETTMKGFLADPALSGYRFFMEKILRYKAHTRSEEVEELLAMSAEAMGAPSRIFSQLDNADMRFGTIEDETGKTHELSHGNFIAFLMNPDRGVRKNAFTTYYEAYEAHKHTIGASLSSAIKKDLFISRAKRFDATLSRALFADNVDKEVYTGLIENVRNGFSPLFDYLSLRKSVLGVDALHIYDTYVPLASDVAFHMDYDEAVEVTLEALAPLGEAYVSTLKKGLTGGWVDRYENRGKRSGAYSSGCYDSNPYILLNHDATSINSLFTLAHEAGHSMHSHYSRTTQPYIYGDYTIFVAEVASTLNEALLGRHLLEKYKGDKKMETYIINREIDNIRGTLYRQTMFAEFEMRIHAMAADNQAITLTTLTDLYGSLLSDYFGDTLEVDEALKLECLRIPHFYSSFYVYKYATGISAALDIAGRILAGEEGAVSRYMEFLTLGGSRFPVDELRIAGVDMTRPDPVNNTIAHFGSLVERLKTLLS
ncbi:oligoendopeptidase F [Desulfoluna spongiiphila]|uniref:Oligopeptidase F n=1 Tax=Desulfoluna spongiiphila TaxID=419481 RepID=A0A1G5AFU7_9BACT|nr:oligoendopeptidase F [Desulfoluna spongiiphila]SCX76752.1 oligopeptidase F. Metallo peptidase. MEROPS family M03B [Desulfoluna spongiiphila]